MKVILLEKIKTLGDVGNIVKVKRGYARNYLVPRHKAVYATDYNLQKFAEERKKFEEKAAQDHQLAVERKALLDAVGELNITVKVGKSGKLFGSVGSRDIILALEKSGFRAEKSEIHMPDGAIREVGVHQVEVSLHSDVHSKLVVNIAREGGDVE